jgi:hypothetical protein
MCFILYAGTTRPIPRREWHEVSTALAVASLTDRDAPIKMHFSSPEVQYIGSTSRCGCDFPHAILQGEEWPTYFLDREEDPTKLASDRFNREALVSLLKKTDENRVELYGVWDGNFLEPPKARENITLERILDSDFWFKEQGFYTVTMGNESSATQDLAPVA